MQQEKILKSIIYQYNLVVIFFIVNLVNSVRGEIMTDRIFRFAQELQGVVEANSDDGWEWGGTTPLEFVIVKWDERTTLEKANITTACTALNFIFNRDV